MSLKINKHLRKLARRATDLVSPPAIILAYHRVIDIAGDPQLLAVSSDNFRDQVQFLKRNRTVVPLLEIVERLRQGKNITKLAAITFDDGYSDNLNIAEPILSKLGVPATFFVTSSAIDSTQEFWWDRLEAMLLLPQQLPGEVEVDICGDVFTFELDNQAPPADWHVLKDAQNNKRCKCYLELCTLLKQLNSELRDNCLNNIQNTLVPDLRPRPENLPMTRDELARLAHSEIAQIGAHTATHSSPASLSENNLLSEMTAPREILAEITGYDIVTMSYPFGSRKDVDQRVVDAANRANYRCACVNWPGYIRRGENLLQLPRVLVRNFSGKVLGAEISRQCDMYR